MRIRSILYLLVLLLWGTLAQAQTTKKETPEERKARIEKIDNAKIAFITEKLNLNGEQAQRFWPLYNEHEARRDDLRHKLSVLKDKDLDKMSEDQLLQGLENRLVYRQRELDLDKEYQEKYLKVLSPLQLAQFYRAEREFTKLLLQRLQTAKK